MKIFVLKNWNSKEEIEFYIGNLVTKVRQYFLFSLLDCFLPRHPYITLTLISWFPLIYIDVKEVKLKQTRSLDNL